MNASSLSMYKNLVEGKKKDRVSASFQLTAEKDWRLAGLIGKMNAFR